MSLASEWMQDHQDATRSLINQGSEALRESNLELAMAALTEAAIILDMSFEESEEQDKQRAQVYNELGVANQRAGDLEEAFAFHQQAALLCDQLMEAGHENFQGNSAATYLNLGTIAAAIGDLEAAIESTTKARERIDAIWDSGERTIAHMAAAAYQTLASLLASAERHEEADAHMKRAIELIPVAEELGNQGIKAQVAQGCQQLSVVYFNQEKYENALDWGRQAETYAEQAFEILKDEALPIYIVSQINLISFNEEMGNFADAEDCLWKAVEIVGNDPRMLKRGKDFYELLRKQADARLEAGNLPREEVEDGYADILARIEEIGGLPDNLDELDEDEEEEIWTYGDDEEE